MVQVGSREALAVERKRRTAAKYAICFWGTVLAPGPSLPPPSRAPFCCPPMGSSRATKSTDDQVLRLQQVFSTTAGVREHCKPSTALWPGY